MSAVEPSGTALPLPAGQALRLTAGQVFVFASHVREGQESRWHPVLSLQAPVVLLGANLPDARIHATTDGHAAAELVDVDDLDAAERDTALDLAPLAERALARSHDDRERKEQADALLRQHDAWLMRDALMELTDAVPGHSDTSGVDERSADIRVMTRLAEFIGLPTDPVRLRAALNDADISGRDRFTALAAACNASVRRLSLPDRWWTSAGPAVLVTNAATSAHGVAHWHRGGYRLWTPASGREVTIDAAINADLDDTGLLLQPLLDPKRPAALRDLMRLGTRGSGSAIAVLLIATLVMALLSAIIPAVAGTLTTSVASATGMSIALVGAALVLAVVATVPLAIVRSASLRRIRIHALASAAAAVWDRELRLPLSWHRRRRQMARVKDAIAVDRAVGGVSDGVVFSLLDSAILIGSIVGAFLVSAWVALALVFVLGIRIAGEAVILRRSNALTKSPRDFSGSATELELLRGVSRLRSSGAVNRAYARWAHGRATYQRSKVAESRLNIAQEVSAALWPTLGLAVMLAVISLTVGLGDGAAALGALVAAQIALSAANSALDAAVSSVGTWQDAADTLQRLGNVLQTTPESAGGAEVPRLSGGIDIHDVSYRYGPGQPNVFRGLSIAVAPGEHLAIVGPSGSGKTTLLRLILGLDDPDSGLIAFDGMDLAGLDRAALRRQIGTVMQSSALLPGSIRENVDLGRGLTHDRIWAALDAADVGEDVRAMPAGIDTVVIEGGTDVSGGQRQRILLARALAGEPRILLLDEATAALDNLTQSTVVANLERLQVTRIVIAHRLSTIERADRIAVLTDGRIVQQGTFTQLLEVDGPFRSLVERQVLDSVATPTR